MNDDYDFGADEDLVAAVEAAEGSLVTASNPVITGLPPPIPVPIPAPAPDRRQKPNQPSGSSSTITAARPRIQQPIPQKLPRRLGVSAIQVSPRQRGNPILSHIKNISWEWASIPADYVLGATTCALFLSLKYHRLHPEYIYSRMKELGHHYNLRIILALVDIENHQEPLKELTNTCSVNNYTLILCWSAREAGRYLELYKTLEHTGPASIRKQEGPGYAERLVDFVTGPRGVNRTDAVALVGSFGSIKASVNAEKEDIARLAGWGEIKVSRWYKAVHQPFRIRTARALRINENQRNKHLEAAIPLSQVPARELTGTSAEVTGPEDVSSTSTSNPVVNPRAEEKQETAKPEEGIDKGIAAALAKLRED